VGAKNRLADRVRLSSSAYFIKWTNIQQTFIDPQCQISSIKNLGEATVKGFDVQADIVISDNWKAETSIGFTQARYKGLYTLTDPGDGTPLVRNQYTTDGDTVGGSPWTVAVGTEYDFSAFGHAWYARVDYEYASRNNKPLPNQNALNNAQFDEFAFRLPKTEFVSLRTGFTHEDWNIAAFIDNVFNKQTPTQYLHSQSGYLNPSDPSAIQFDQGGFRPRTIGLTVTYRH
jgi:outer membrane receptor for ferrienterochelin and colicin